MKKIIMSGMILIILSVFLGGCLVAVEDHGRGGHRGDRDRERHEERHEDRRY